MKKNIITILIITLLSMQISFAADGIKILKISGDVKIRKGLDETWQKAEKNVVLDEMDTILSEKNSLVVLRLANNENFQLNENTLLDMSELKEVSEKELFFYLTSRKIDNIKPRDQKAPVRIGNVSVVHGESKSEEKIERDEERTRQLWLQEKNGAIALMKHNLYSNAIIKFYKIKSKYLSISDCGEIDFYLGESFEQIGKPGLAMDAFNTSLKNSKEAGCQTGEVQKRIKNAQDALKRLKK